MVLNDIRKRGRSVSRNFKKYQFFEKEKKPDSIKCGFKADQILTAIKETDHTHTISTSEGKIIHIKLASKPLKFQISRKLDELRKTISRCRRCGKFSSDEYCETHWRLKTDGDLNNNQADNEAGTSRTIPTMPSKKLTYSRVVMYDSSSRDSDSMVPNVDKESSDTDSNSEETSLKAEIGRQIKTLRAQTPTMTSPFGCSTLLFRNSIHQAP